MKRAVLLDMDGVLVDSYEAWFCVTNAAAERFRCAAITRERFASIWGQGIADDVKTLYPGRTVDEVARAYDELFAQHVAQVAVDPEAAPALEELARRGHRAAVVTNTPRDVALAILAHAGLSPAALAAGTDVARPKPAPDLLLHACRVLGAAPEHAWMVGDSRYDEEAARAARVPFIGYRRPGDRRIERLSELLGVVSS